MNEQVSYHEEHTDRACLDKFNTQHNTITRLGFYYKIVYNII